MSIRNATAEQFQSKELRSIVKGADNGDSRDSESVGGAERGNGLDCHGNQAEKTAMIAPDSTITAQDGSQEGGERKSGVAAKCDRQIVIHTDYAEARRDALRRISDVLLRAERAGVVMDGVVDAEDGGDGVDEVRSANIENGLIFDCQDKLNESLIFLRNCMETGMDDVVKAKADVSESLADYERAVLSQWMSESEIEAEIYDGTWLDGVKEMAAGWPQWAKARARALANWYQREWIPVRIRVMDGAGAGGQRGNSGRRWESCGVIRGPGLPRREATERAAREMSQALSSVVGKMVGAKCVKI